MVDWLVPLASGVLGGTAINAVLSYLLARRRLPVERVSAHAAASREIAQAAESLVEPLRNALQTLDERLQRAEDDAAKAREDAASARTDAEAARREAGALRKLASEADDYIRDLHARWEAHRVKPHPPFWRWLSAD